MDKRIKVGENGMYIKSVADKEGSIIYFETYREPVTMNQLGEREASIAIGDVIWENGFEYGFMEFEGSSDYYHRHCFDACTIRPDARSLRIIKNIYEVSNIPDRNQAVAALEALIELQTKRVPRPDFLNGRFSTRKFPDYDDKNSLSAFVKEYSVIAQKIVIMIPPLESALSNVIKWNLPEMTFAKIAGDDLSYINSRVTPYKKAENKVHSTFGKFLDRMFPVANIIDQVEKALDTRLDISTKKAAFLHGGAQGSPRNLEHERKQG
jgi:hypothetical protein